MKKGHARFPGARPCRMKWECWLRYAATGAGGIS